MKELVSAKNFSSLASVYLITVKALQEIFSQIFHSPPQKSNGQPLSYFRLWVTIKHFRIGYFLGVDYLNFEGGGEGILEDFGSVS